MNIDIKILNNTTTKLNATTYKKDYTMTKWDLFQEWKVGLISENQLM